MTEIINACPICNSTDHRRFESIRQESAEIHYLICGTCGAVFQSPRMSPEELDAFYKEGYRTLYQDSETPTKKDIVMQIERAKQILALVRTHVQSVHRYLDIGSSSGALLGEFQKAYSCESVGIEPGDAYRSFSRSQGYQTYSSLESLPEDGVRFDLVSMMHVLEHLPHPVASLRQIHENWLAPEGYLLLEVPNLIEHEALEIAHLFAFTRDTLRETVRQAGFRVLWTKTHGGFRSPVLKLYITLLAQVLDRPSLDVPVHSSSMGIATLRRIGRCKRRWLTKYLPDWTWQSPESLWEKSD